MPYPCPSSDRTAVLWFMYPTSTADFDDLCPSSLCDVGVVVCARTVPFLANGRNVDDGSLSLLPEASSSELLDCPYAGAVLLRAGCLM
jgi:hypothetical protein